MKIIIYNKSDCTDDVALEMIGKSLSKEIDLRGRWTTTYFTIQNKINASCKKYQVTICQNKQSRSFTIFNIS